MAEVIRMPKMSDTMTEGVISSWLVKVGDTVTSGAILAEVETDKATMELENYEDGIMLYLAVEVGKAVLVDGIIAIVGEKDADYKLILEAEIQNQKESSTKKDVQADSSSNEEKTTVSASSSSSEVLPIEKNNLPESNGRIKASPLAKKLALEKGYNLKQIQGTGDFGRVIKRDVENFVPSIQQISSAKPLGTIGQEIFKKEKVSQMRKVIAQKLAESKFTAPHFYLTMEINMDKTIEARKGMNEFSSIKISFNDLVIKAAAIALRKHPQVNSSWLEDVIRYNEHIHIGVAVAVDEGLLVPVVRFADNKSLSQIGAEVKDLAGKAKDKKLQPSDWEGNTFTISNLGMFGIEEFTAIINPPDACILAVGGIKQTAIVKDGQLAVGNIMKVTLSCDHRVVDGVIGSAFLQTFKQLLENPVRLLV